MNATVTFPDSIAEEIHLTPETVLLDVAIGIYKREQWSMGRCGRIVGMTRAQFQEELEKREIPMNYGATDFDQDITTMESLFTDLT